MISFFFSMLTILFSLFRSLLSLRYRIQLENFSLFETDAPIVVFPNHPALIDPIIVTSFIGKKKILSPVMTESYFNTPGL